MLKTNRIDLFLARQRKHVTRDTMYVVLLIAAAAVGLGAIAL